MHILNGTPALPSRDEGDGLRLTWADLPALLLASVSAITVTAGARLLRGQDRSLMLLLGVGVAGATIVLEKLLVERLNSVRPRQSLAALLLCWLPLFLFSTALATFATFSWIAPELARRDLEQSRRVHWTREADKVSKYLVQLRSALRQNAGAIQAGIEAERRRAAEARQEGQPYPTEPLRALQRKVGSSRDLERRISAFDSPPLEAPDESAAGARLDRAFRDLDDLQATAATILPAPPGRPVYEPYAPPSSDLQSVLGEETRRGSWSAMTAWGAAFWVELLPLLALWRGGRKITLASRVRQWRLRITETHEALRSRRQPPPLPIVIEPLQVRGLVRVTSAPEYTLGECTPLLQQAVESLTSVLGSYQLRGTNPSYRFALDVRDPAAVPADPRRTRIELERGKMERGLLKLVLSLVELLRQLMEKQASRRIDAGSLTDEEVERVGGGLMELELKIRELQAQFGIDDLAIDLGPLGSLIDSRS